MKVLPINKNQQQNASFKAKLTSGAKKCILEEFGHTKEGFCNAKSLVDRFEKVGNKKSVVDVGLETVECGHDSITIDGYDYENDFERHVRKIFFSNPLLSKTALEKETVEYSEPVSVVRFIESLINPISYEQSMRCIEDTLFLKSKGNKLASERLTEILPTLELNGYGREGIEALQEVAIKDDNKVLKKIKDRIDYKQCELENDIRKIREQANKDIEKDKESLAGMEQKIRESQMKLEQTKQNAPILANEIVAEQNFQQAVDEFLNKV